MRTIKNFLLGVGMVLLAILFDNQLKEKKMEKIPSEWSTGMKLWLLAALMVILINMLAARNAYGQAVVIRAPLNNYGAITTCDSENRIVVVVSTEVSSSEYPFVMVHEGTHVEQMKRYPGGCLALMKEYRASPEARLRIESEAYCEDFKERVRQGLPYEMISKLATYLQKEYAPNLSVAEVQQKLPCNIPFAPKDGTQVVPP